ncbi:ABC transporter ATP-binding protein [Candidatus Woesearchaeota archaeon]|jgi:ATP-binding cassette, subfamily B, bacterial|nr:ABC transporter ATP-binding protein [Candidatus Woesearchaeota archaeon]MBT4151332.1 ABC transporter ATP-binding protein [Candidatus Woesearchaeota archaeon]MBT4247431.1 ABC transporter ATP-binding protein [Candidatus Woesearchaeota archaeon]MBT4434154.1 ABC transporter ATP-binding protein [Candidatus Woesearchaeota archaeon]MBT7332471.1 ABC transporter ATP-binding protein [Candidatus Woesearchaeota archaeon]
MSNPIISLSKLMWKFSEKKSVISFYVLFLFSNTVDFFHPLIVGKILNIIQEQGINAENIGFITLLLSGFIILNVAFWAFHGPGRVIELGNAFNVRSKYKKYLIDGTMELPAQWHTDHHSGDTIDKINKSTDALYKFSSENFIIIESVLRLISSYIALAYFNLHAGYIVLFMIVTTIWLILKFDKKLVPQWNKLLKAENTVSAKIFDTISNITTVIILRVGKLVSKSIMSKIMKPFSLYKENININETKWFFVSLSSAIMTFLVLFTYIFTNYKSGVLIGTIFVLYEYVGRINSLFFRFAYKYSDIVQQQTTITNVEEISDEFKKIKKVKQHPLQRWNEMKVEALEFTYHTEKGAHPHIDNVSLTIKRNQKIALIGDSGSGKTTFLKVMRDIYSPRYVNLYIDGKIVKDGFKSISSYISLIPQDPEIFSSTIKENITLGLKHTDLEIKLFTDMARFSDVVKKLPNGLKSSIVEKGVNLSGGEKQRLALSRGLLASEDKEIILLDEPTSSVDSKNELLIYQNIFNRFKNKTIISSIHRLHLLPLFDQIYFFKNGKIIASGDYRQLKRRSSEFQMMLRKYRNR